MSIIDGTGSGEREVGCVNCHRFITGERAGNNLPVYQKNALAYARGLHERIF